MTWFHILKRVLKASKPRRKLQKQCSTTRDHFSVLQSSDGAKEVSTTHITTPTISDASMPIARRRQQRQISYVEDFERRLSEIQGKPLSQASAALLDEGAVAVEQPQRKEVKERSTSQNLIEERPSTESLIANNLLLSETLDMEYPRLGCCEARLPVFISKASSEPDSPNWIPLPSSSSIGSLATGTPALHDDDRLGISISSPLEQESDRYFGQSSKKHNRINASISQCSLYAGPETGDAQSNLLPPSGSSTALRCGDDHLSEGSSHTVRRYKVHDSTTIPVTYLDFGFTTSPAPGKACNDSSEEMHSTTPDESENDHMQCNQLTSSIVTDQATHVRSETLDEQLVRSYTDPVIGQSGMQSQPLRSKKEGLLAAKQAEIDNLSAELRNSENERARLLEIQEDLNNCVNVNLESMTGQQSEITQLEARLAFAQEHIDNLNTYNQKLVLENKRLLGRAINAEYNCGIANTKLAHCRAMMDRV